MIPDLAERRRFWAEPRSRGPDDGHDLYDSLPYPFEDAGIESIFHGADVLEIGPGRGRQYERVRPHVRTASVADIAPEALLEPAFLGARDRFLITNWDKDLGRRFDVVHFWYVLHHVIWREMRDFFRFVRRHLRRGGIAAFNTPMPINVQGAPQGDGTGTTRSDLVTVRLASYPMEVLHAIRIDRCSTGWVIALGREDG